MRKKHHYEGDVISVCVGGDYLLKSKEKNLSIFRFTPSRQVVGEAA